MLPRSILPLLFAVLTGSVSAQTTWYVEGDGTAASSACWIDRNGSAATSEAPDLEHELDGVVRRDA